ncbi:hypothetical protein [Spirosoma pollinicola]|uniref:Uncharacterized protein n=1 Tax=Spirosoma pollinicola TaxID=2057025 RepID=A0A2K8Z7B1_9BACT|nr:hypothetical protein [Spirosoma pollinicola]AUD05724.1 hypothetical protein CWM47_30100 [Spirosoma pollinicola]
MTPFKIRISIITILLLFVGEIYAQQAPDFRSVRWGYRPKQVKESETVKPYSTKKDKLIYSQLPLADRKVGLEYDFNGDSLHSASYFYYSTASITKDDVLAAATDFESLLTEKYGRGKASFLGDTRNVAWLTPRTQISLSVGNVDRGWSVEIVYLCRVCSGEVVKAVQGRNAYKPLKDIKDF